MRINLTGPYLVTAIVACTMQAQASKKHADSAEKRFTTCDYQAIDKKIFEGATADFLKYSECARQLEAALNAAREPN